MSPRHGTHYWNNEISPLSPPILHPSPNTQKTPHTSCIEAPEKLDRNLKMADI